MLGRVLANEEAGDRNVRQDVLASAQHERPGASRVDFDRGKSNALLAVRREAHAHSHALLDGLGPPVGLCRLEEAARLGGGRPVVPWAVVRVVCRGAFDVASAVLVPNLVPVRPQALFGADLA